MPRSDTENSAAKITTEPIRRSGKPFSAIGELLWYLSGSDQLDFIKHYIRRYEDDAVDGVLQGAYGPRLLRKNGSINQIENVADLLARRPGSRRAVIQLFDAEDIAVEKKSLARLPCSFICAVTNYICRRL